MSPSSRFVLGLVALLAPFLAAGAGAATAWLNRRPAQTLQRPDVESTTEKGK